MDRGIFLSQEKGLENNWIISDQDLITTDPLKVSASGEVWDLFKARILSRNMIIAELLVIINQHYFKLELFHFLSSKINKKTQINAVI